MSTKDTTSNDIAVKYLGIALIITIVGFVVYAIVTQGYNTYISVSHEKIEVQATNSNSNLNDTEEWALLISLFLYNTINFI